MMPTSPTSHSSTTPSTGPSTSSSLPPSISSDRIYLKKYSKNSENNPHLQMIYSVSKATLDQLQKDSHSTGALPAMTSFTIDPTHSEAPFSELENEAIHGGEAFFSSLLSGNYLSAGQSLQILERGPCTFHPLTAFKALRLLLNKVCKESVGIIQQLIKIIKIDPQFMSGHSVSAQVEQDLAVEELLSLLQSNNNSGLKQLMGQLNSKALLQVTLFRTLEVVLDLQDFQKIQKMLSCLLWSYGLTPSSASRALTVQQTVFSPSSNTARPLAPSSYRGKTVDFLAALDPTLFEARAISTPNLISATSSSSSPSSFLRAQSSSSSSSSSAASSSGIPSRLAIKREKREEPDTEGAPEVKRRKIKPEPGTEPSHSSSSSSVNTQTIRTHETSLSQPVEAIKDKQELCIEREQSWLAAVRIGDLNALRDLSEKDKIALCRMSAAIRLEALKVVVQQRRGEIAVHLLRHESNLRTSIRISNVVFNGPIYIDDIQLSNLLLEIAKENNGNLFELFLASPAVFSPTIQTRTALAAYKESRRDIALSILKKEPAIDRSNDPETYLQLNTELLTILSTNEEEELLEALLAKLPDMHFKSLIDNCDKISNSLLKILLERYPNNKTTYNHLNNFLFKAVENRQLQILKTLISVKDKKFTCTGLKRALNHILKSPISEEKYLFLETILQTSLVLNKDAIEKLSTLIGDDVRAKKLFDNYLARVLGVRTI